MQLYLIPIDQINSYWKDIKQPIENACEYNGNKYNSNDCLVELLSGEKQLWLVLDTQIKAVVITCIMKFPQCKCCMIDICTGTGINEWVHLLKIIEEWAVLKNCREMFFIARLGMEKKLKEFGYRKTHSLLEKSL